jgi:Tol biopolymer transport system component
MPEDRHSNGRLDSWKEIAAYLNRDVRTVIRWEDKGLPVHRVPGGKRQAVFAYPAEIDGWMAGGQNSNDNPSSQQPNGSHPEPQPNGNHVSPKPNGNRSDAINDHHAETSSGVNATAPVFSEPDHIGSTQTGSRSRISIKFERFRWKVALAAAGLLGLVWILGAVFAPLHTSATLPPFSLKQLTDNGWPKGNLKTDGTTLYFTQTQGARWFLSSAPVSGHPIHSISTPFSNVALQDLSRDGKTLLITSYEGILIEGPLWTIPAQGGAPQRVSDAVCRIARWSPDNTRIACANQTTLNLMNSDGSNPRAIATFTEPVSQLSWSPDGSELRYVLGETTTHTSSQWEVRVTPELRDMQPHELALGSGCCVDWAWTRDGKAFVYTWLDESEKVHLAVQTRSGRAMEVPLRIGNLWSVAPGKSGNDLYLSIADSSRGELLKFDSRQKALQTFLPGVSAAFVAFSPDGQWITYSNTQDYSLWRSRADGSDALQLTKTPMQVQVSSWSPDGREIAFMEQAPGKPWRIYLIGRDGGPAREVSEGNDNQGGPSFSPNGKSMVYGNVFCEETQNCWIRRVDLATHKSEIIPGSNGLRTARWSPDGKYIAALRFRSRELIIFDVRTRRWRVLAESVAGDNVNWSSDSRYVYVDSPRDEKPVIEKIRIVDGQRSTVLSLASLQKAPGTTDNWFGLTPDNSPLLCHMFNSSEIYALDWK